MLRSIDVYNKRWKGSSDKRRGTVDTFERACREADRRALNGSSEPPPELTDEVIINLAGLTPLQYAQQLGLTAKKYKTPVKLLEKAVEAARLEREADKLLEAHWEVVPAEEPVDVV